MARVVPFPSERERVFAGLSPNERDFVEHLLRISPNYQYELSGLPKLDPTPAPGLESAARCREGSSHSSCDAP